MRSILLVFIFLFSVTPLSALDFSEEKRLYDRELKQKKEGFYVTGVVGPASTPDLGFIIGGALFLFENGDRNDERFPYTAFNHKLEISGAYSTKKMSSAAIVYDAPYLQYTHNRLRIVLNFYHNPVSQYFGANANSMKDLSPLFGSSFSSYSDYYNSIRTVQSDGSTLAYFDYYNQRKFKGAVNWMYDFFQGKMRFLFGFVSQQVEVSDYTGKSIDINGYNLTMRQTRLFLDNANGLITGGEGGAHQTIKIGFAYDSRDLEPNPRRGVFHDLILAYSNKNFASDSTYSYISNGYRFYYSPIARDLVIAGRYFYSYYYGEVPFYEMSNILQMDREISGLGGIYSLRGYRENRFLAKIITAFTLEVRYHFVSWSCGDQKFQLMLAPFWDTGRVFDSWQEANFYQWRHAFGAGIRLVWNQNTIISFDYGVSSEDQGLYLNINQIF